jgi:ankyrin repeat protein
LKLQLQAMGDNKPKDFIHAVKTVMDYEMKDLIEFHKKKPEKFDINQKCEGSEDTALHIVARSGKFQQVKLLMENGASAKEQNKDQDTPLHVVVLQLASVKRVQYKSEVSE